MKQSTYYSSSPEQTAAQFLKQTRRAKAACIALLAGLAAFAAAPVRLVPDRSHQ